MVYILYFRKRKYKSAFYSEICEDGERDEMHERGRILCTYLS